MKKLLYIIPMFYWNINCMRPAHSEEHRNAHIFKKRRHRDDSEEPRPRLRQLAPPPPSGGGKGGGGNNIECTCL